MSKHTRTDSTEPYLLGKDGQFHPRETAAAILLRERMLGEEHAHLAHLPRLHPKISGWFLFGFCTFVVTAVAGLCLLLAAIAR